jgi:peptidoglycan hydrolase CwlO-like protein
MIRVFRLLSIILLSLAFLGLINPSYAQTASPTPSSNASELEKQIDEYQAKVSELQAEGKTLSSQISVMDNQIKLSNLKIKSIEEQISSLTLDIDTADKKIKKIDGSLEGLSKILMNRIVATYKVGSNSSFQALLASDDISDYFKKSAYLKVVQANDKRLIYDTVQARNDYANQKSLFEDKKNQIGILKIDLDKQKEILASQKSNKENLLNITLNDEKKYQELLAKARAEYSAIQGIVAGNGTETEAGPVSEGQKIASIISGPSCNSSGGHVHFMVSINGITQNPFTYLRSTDSVNCSGSSCGSADGDSFNPSGSWIWPVDGTVTMFQGYGSTWATRNTWIGKIYSSHNGIDIKGSNFDVKAVRSGTLYKGSYAGSGGCRLPYVKVRQDDGLDTFYLHVYN